MISGAEGLVRPVSSGMQVYETHPSMYPITEPVKKLEALAQVSGNLNYIITYYLLKKGILLNADVLGKCLTKYIIQKKRWEVEYSQ